MNKITTIIISLFCLFICVQTDAQSKSSKSKKKKIPLNHEISFYGAGGLSNLSYQPTVGNKGLGFGGDFGLGYTFFVKPQWGIGTGAGIAMFNAATTLDGFEYTIPDLFDGEDDFDLHTTFNKWTEKQRVTMLTIPLTATYRKDWKENRWYVGAGVKIGLPLSAASNVNNGAVSKQGYYPDYDNWATTQQFMGFGEYSGISVKNKLSMKTAIFASIDAGLQWKMKENLLIYTGIYLDYGLNSIASTEKKKPLMTWNLDSPQDFQPNSLLNVQADNADGFTDKISPIAAGIKVRVSFAFADKSAVKKQKRQEKDEKAEKERLIAEKERLAAEEAERQRLIAEETVRKQQAEQAEEEARLQLIAEEENKQRQAADQAQQQVNDIAREEYLFAISEIEQTYSEFRLDQIEPSASTKTELDNVAELMSKYPAIKIVIEGHTCDIGSNDLNMRVGQHRADAAKKYLTDKGMDPDRIYTDSKGDTEPVLPNTSEEYRRKNRRIEIKVLELTE
jgi:outer membrane protein OmpA-like peptidoglycan-associated protein